mgnify:FL=1
MKLDHSDTVLENAKSAIGPLDKADESKSEAAQPPAKGEEIAKWRKQSWPWLLSKSYHKVISQYLRVQSLKHIRYSHRVRIQL